MRVIILSPCQPLTPATVLSCPFYGVTPTGSASALRLGEHSARRPGADAPGRHCPHAGGCAYADPSAMGGDENCHERCTRRLGRTRPWLTPGANGPPSCTGSPVTAAPEFASGSTAAAPATRRMRHRASHGRPIVARAHLASPLASGSMPGSSSSGERSASANCAGRASATISS